MAWSGGRPPPSSQIWPRREGPVGRRRRLLPSPSRSGRKRREAGATAGILVRSPSSLGIIAHRLPRSFPTHLASTSRRHLRHLTSPTPPPPRRRRWRRSSLLLEIWPRRREAGERRRRKALGGGRRRWAMTHGAWRRRR